VSRNSVLNLVVMRLREGLSSASYSVHKRLGK
jgi:hypothetical protein